MPTTATPVNGYYWNYTIIGISPNETASIGTGVNVADATTATTTITGAVIIPDSLDGKQVTKIDNFAFQDCTNLTSVTIPSSVTSIGLSCFLSCTSLATAALPTALTYLGHSSFRECNKLTSVTIPNSVTIIRFNTFINCTSLTSVTIGTSVTSIESNAFDACTNVNFKSVTIPNSVTTIGNNAFSSCNRLTSVTIGTSVTSIGSECFRYCSSLTSINIPASVKTIDTNAFANNNQALTVTINQQQTINGNLTTFNGTNKPFFGATSVDFAPPRPTMTITSTTVTGGSITNVNPITLTFTSSASTSDFDVGDISVSNGSLNSSFASTSATVYNATFTPNGQGPVVCTINVPANVFTAGGLNNAASNTFTFTFDAAPSMIITSTIASGSTTNIASIPLTFTASEAITGFIKEDISFNKGSLTAFDGSGSVYTATFTQGGEGVHTINVPVGAYADASGNNNTVASTFNWTYDSFRPSIEISATAGGSAVTSGSRTKNTPISLTFTASEAITGFQAVDISFNNGTFPYPLTNSGDNKVYNATFAPNEGLNTIYVPEGAFTDSAGNNNTASNTFTFTFDSVSPTMDISSNVISGSITKVQPITLTFTSSEPTIDFTNNDISFNKGVFSYPLTTSDNMVYNATFDPVEGLNTFYVPAGAFIDAAGNSNTASNTFTFTFDSIGPTMDISSNVASGSTTKNTPITLKFTSSEPTTDFTNNDISFNNGTFPYQLDGSGSVYTATFPPIQGVNTIYVPAGAFTDAVGNNNAASNTFTFTFDSVQPTMDISSNVANGSITNVQPITLTFTSSEPTTDFNSNDISFNNGTFPHQLDGSGSVYTATFVPVQGVNTFYVPAGAFTDSAGNNNTASNTFTFTFDSVPPTMDISSNVANGSMTKVHPITVTFTSSEPTTDFSNNDISFNNGTFPYQLDGSGSVYTATFDPVEGVNTFYVPAGAFTDSVGNNNTASNTFTFTFDSVRPTMDISSNVANGSTTKNTPISLTFTASEAITGFQAVDISFNNGTFSYPLTTSDNMVYNATFAPVEGVNTIYVPAGAFTDSAGNNNTASNTFTFTFDSVSPTMDISSNVISGSITNVQPITLTFTSSEPTIDFTNNDISFNKGVFSYPLTTSDNMVYNATFDPVEGLNTFYVPAGAYIDAAGNSNTASNTFTFTFDSVSPTMDISSNVASGSTTKNTPITITFISSEPTTNFSNNDISFNNGTFPYQLDGSGSVYNATFPPIEGVNTIYVPAGAYIDAAGNSNTASNTFTFTFDSVSPTMDISSNVISGSITNVQPITLTFTSSEPTTDFTNNDISFNNGTFPYQLDGSGSVYTATITPTVQGVNTFYVPAGAFTDSAGNNNTASNTFTFTFDSVSPTMDISSNVISGSITKVQPITLTFTSSEPTTDFSNDDISFNNGTFPYPLTTSDNIVYTATITPTVQGVNTIYVPAGAFTDAVGNNNAASNTFTFTFDSVRPTMDISSNVANGSITNVQPITLKFTSSEPTTDFTNNDISFNNGTFPYSLTTSDNTVYNATFSPPIQGLYTFYVPAGAFIDSAGNNNTASKTFTFTFDSIPPTMDISSNVVNGSTTNNDTIELTFIASEAITGFTRDDISFNNGTLSEVTKSSDTVYAAIFSPYQGLCTISVPAGAFDDYAGNSNTASNPFTFTFDSVRPIMDISSNDVASGSATNKAITLNFTSSKPTNNFEVGDISLTNGSLFSSFARISDTVYTAIFTPIGQGACTIDVASGAFTDDVGNNNIASNTFTWTYDSISPTMDISAGVARGSTTNVNPIELRFTSSEATTNFAVEDISFNNGTLSNFTAIGGTDGKVYTARFTPTGLGPVACTIDVLAGAYTDAATNLNNLATQFAFTYDGVLPTMDISANVANNATTNNSSIELRFTSSEPTNNFVKESISVTNGTLPVFTAISETVYTATFTPTSSGPVACTIDVDTDKFTDAAGNGNTAATQYAFTFDSVRPTMDISSNVANNAITNNASIELTFTSSEPTNNFVKESITVANGTLPVFTSISETVYTATFSPTGLGPVACTINVDADKFTDAAGNGNTAATQYAFTFDSARPTMDISSNVANNATTNNASIELTFTSSEPTNNFVKESITVTNGTLPFFTAISETVYTATFTPTGSGPVACTIGVASGAYTDAAGNGNTAATQYAFTFDSVQPTMDISSNVANNAITNNASIELTFTSTEPTNNFVKESITVTNGTLPVFNSISATVYTATFTPISPGPVACTINVAEGAYTDAAGNGNAASTQYAFTFDSVQPTMTIRSNVANNATTNNASIELTFTSSEPTNNFVKESITVTNGTLPIFTAISETVYTATFTPTGSGPIACTINVASGSYTDAAGNGNTAATQYAFTFDSVPPDMTIESTTHGIAIGSITDNEIIALTFTSTKATNNFVVGDITVTNGKLTDFAGSGTDGKVYTATFTPTGSSACIVDVAAGSYTDAAGNSNNAATRFNWTFRRNVSFDTNTLTISNSIDANATDLVLFVLPSGEEMFNINVTSFTGNGTITYDLSTDGASVSSGTFTESGTNLLGTNLLIASTNTTYILTLAANASITYTIVGTKIVNYGNVTPTALSFVNNTLTIQNIILSTDVDKVSFDVTAGSLFYSLKVTNLLNTNSISYVLDISGGSTLSSGSFTQAGVNLLNGNLLQQETNTTYNLTLTCGGTNTYSIVGMTEGKFDIDKFCSKQGLACNNVGYNRLVTSNNDPSISNKMRYSQLLRTQRFKNIQVPGARAPALNTPQPLYLFATGQIFARSAIPNLRTIGHIGPVCPNR